MLEKLPVIARALSLPEAPLLEEYLPFQPSRNTTAMPAVTEF